MGINAQTGAVIMKRQSAAPQMRNRGTRGTLPPQPQVDPSAISQALQALSTYIPGEIITLYLLAVGAWESIKAGLGLNDTILYWAFVILTPILWFLVYLAKIRSVNNQNLAPMPWPLVVWFLVASTIAFAAWALALAPRPYLQGQDGAVALLVVAVSIILGLIGQIVTRGQKVAVASS